MHGAGAEPPPPPAPARARGWGLRGPLLGRGQPCPPLRPPRGGEWPRRPLLPGTTVLPSARQQSECRGRASPPRRGGPGEARGCGGTVSSGGDTPTAGGGGGRQGEREGEYEVGPVPAGKLGASRCRHHAGPGPPRAAPWPRLTLRGARVGTFLCRGRVCSGSLSLDARDVAAQERGPGQTEPRWNGGSWGRALLGGCRVSPKSPLSPVGEAAPAKTPG